MEGDSLKITYNYKNTEQYKLRKKFQLIRDYSIGNLIKESYEEYYRKNYEKTLFDKFYTLFNSNNKKKKKVKTTDGDYRINRSILENMKEYNNTSTKIFVVKSTDFPGNYDNLVSKLQLSVINLDSVLSKYAKVLTYYIIGKPLTNTVTGIIRLKILLAIILQILCITIWIKKMECRVCSICY